MSLTKLSSLINPEVMADMVSAELEHALKATGFMKVDTTLTGAPGNTIRVPRYGYVGKADDLAEGVTGEVTELTATDAEYTVKKATKNIELTDEALLSGYGDPAGEAVRQLKLSIADKMDYDGVAALSGITSSNGLVLALETTTISYDDVIDGLDLFETEEQGGEYYLMVPRPLAKAIRKDTKFVDRESLGGDEVLATGVVGSIGGCKVIINKRLSDDEAFILKKEALTVFLKRDTTIETQRDILKKSTIISADKHFVVAIEDYSEVVKIVVAEETETDSQTNAG